MNDEALGGNARLSTVERPCLHPGLEGSIEVGVVEDNKRVGPTEFQHGLFQVFAGRFGDGTTGGTTSRKRRRADTVVCENAGDIA